MEKDKSYSRKGGAGAASDPLAELSPERKAEKFLRRYVNTREAYRDYDKVKQKCLNMVHGVHFDRATEEKRTAKGLPSLAVDKTMGVVSTLDGWARRQRKDTQFIPLGSDDPDAARMINDLYMGIRAGKSLHMRQSETFCLAATVDEAYLHIFAEQNAAGQLEPSAEALQAFECYPEGGSGADPVEMKDAERIYIVKYMSPEAVQRVLGRYLDADTRERLTRFSEDTYESGLTRNSTITWDDRHHRNGQLEVVKVYYRHYKTLKTLVDKDSGTVRPFDPSEEKMLTPEVLEAMNFEVQEVERDQIWCAYMIPALKLQHLILDAQADFQPLNAQTGRMYWPVVRLPHKHIGGKAVGAIRTIIKLQEARNLILSAFQHHLQTASNGGFIVEKGAFADDEEKRKFKQERNRANITIEAKDGALKEQRIRPIEQGEMAFGQAGQIFEAVMLDAIRDVTGAEPVMRGQGQAGAPASLFAMQVEQSSNQTLMSSDLYSEFQDVTADIIMAFVRQHYTEERMIQVVGAAGDPRTLVINQETAAGIKNDVTGGLFTVRKTEVPQTQSARRQRLRETAEVLELMQKLGFPSFLLDFEDLIRDLEWPQEKKERVLQQFEAWKASQGLGPPAQNTAAAPGMSGEQPPPLLPSPEQPQGAIGVPAAAQAAY